MQRYEKTRLENNNLLQKFALNELKSKNYILFPISTHEQNWNAFAMEIDYLEYIGSIFYI